MTLVFICLAQAASLRLALAEDIERNVVVNAESDDGEHNEFTEMGEYGQPAWAERNRASSTTKAYVLSPYEAFLGLSWEGDFGSGAARHDFAQEIEMGFPHRIELGIENDAAIIRSSGYESSITFEARYAFADWNKLPFNPALSVEYAVGLGPDVDSKEIKRRRRDPAFRDVSDAVTPRLLLSRAFADDHLAYALNIGLRQSVDYGSDRQFQLSQSLSYGLGKGEVELGAEMRYTHWTARSVAGNANELLLGPVASWKPTRQTRLSCSPLFGCTNDSPAVAVVVLFSYEFGGAEAVMPPVAAGAR